METLNTTVKNTKTYSIYFEKDLSNLYEYVKALNLNFDKILIVSDSNVASLYMSSLKDTFSKEASIIEYIIPAGEASKCMNNVTDCLSLMIKENMHRNDLVIALGGGVTGDFAGFVASLFLRGITFINIPTTLLSMCDSSVGGKTAVDFDGYKNMVGAFYNPSLVYINTEFLKSLPEREYYAGFAEIMKAGLIKDSKFYMWLIENMYEICDKDNDVLSEMIFNAVSIKKYYVDKDPFETTGDRALLNLGHTIGHAIESTFKGEYIHGECVSLGIVAASYISWKKNMISMEDYYEIRDMLVPFNLPISIVTKDVDSIVEAVYKDKKASDNNVRMVLLQRIGKAVLCDNIEIDLIKEAVNELNFDEEE